MSKLKRGGRDRRVPGYNDKIRPRMCVANHDGVDGDFIGVRLFTLPRGEPIPFLDIVIRAAPKAFILTSSGDLVPAISAVVNEEGGVFVEFPAGAVASGNTFLWPAWDESVRLTTGEWLPPQVVEYS